MPAVVRPAASAARGRVRAWVAGALAAIVTVVGSSPLVGCGQDPAPACNEAYQHLIAIAKRNHEPVLLSRFVDACTSAWDPARVKCLMAATNASEAIQCKSKKKRPG